MAPTMTETAFVPRVDEEDLLRMMEEVASYGATADEGTHRLTLSVEDKLARDWFVRRAESEGAKLRVDRAGNMFAVFDWAGPDAPTIMTGSHLDSQPNGGRFDGALGVVTGWAAASALEKARLETGVVPKANLTVVNWTNEEGARFQPSLLGSGFHAGVHDADFVLSRRDGDGVTVAEALGAIGYAGSDEVPLADALIELHIEGAEGLERTGRRFGVFTRFWGAVKYRLAFIGRQAHTGPTPMADRRDALLAAGHVVVGLREMADRGGLDLHTSAGRLEVRPNSPNVVPGEAVLFIELRSAVPEILASAERELNERIAAAAKSARVEFEIRSIDRRAAGSMDPRLVQLAVEAGAAIGTETMKLDTVAGHDAISLASRIPVVVVVVPSVAGVIHHPSEFTSVEDRLIGARALTEMLRRLCFEDGFPRGETGT